MIYRIMTVPAIAVLGAISIVLSFEPGFAQDVAHGKMVAKTWCAGCHQTNSGGEELRNLAVPSFTAIADHTELNQAKLEAFISKPHPRMMTYGLSHKDVRDVSAYILSLRR